jgi:hypothetical protein
VEQFEKQISGNTRKKLSYFTQNLFMVIYCSMSSIFICPEVEYILKFHIISHLYLRLGMMFDVLNGEELKYFNSRSMNI